ncbi:putative nwd2 protein [Mycena sanguinolenta]|uniref:Putative nwd2 protein n=1 Tax=Mycena sanguinolenta TaxID=230812 RepID=A0A8H6Z8E6_9AGAR|nr:putative nwd2 protein [Mycena sanguinolenta]
MAPPLDWRGPSLALAGVSSSIRRCCRFSGAVDYWPSHVCDFGVIAGPTPSQDASFAPLSLRHSSTSKSTAHSAPALPVTCASHHDRGSSDPLTVASSPLILPIYSPHPPMPCEIPPAFHSMQLSRHNLAIDRDLGVREDTMDEDERLKHGERAMKPLHAQYLSWHIRVIMFPDIRMMNNYINAGNFTMNNVQQGERGIDILHRAVALEAIHDSAESYPQPRCHPETRTKMLEDLHEWSLASDSETTILWLYGPAGAGKPAIMQTLARQLREANVLGGSFFFKRSHATRGNAKTLFATIAYQLALAIPWLRAPISQIVETDPSLVQRNIETQMTKLISEPCRSCNNCYHVAVLIDGLDECEDSRVQQEILRVIRNVTFNHPIPLRFIIASRPEPHIRKRFNSPVYSGNYDSFNVEQSFNDVRKYLSDEFSRIHCEALHYGQYPVAMAFSSGHFIYAATIIKFIDDPTYRPAQRLAMVLGSNSQGSPFGALDQLYMDILRSAPRQSELIPILCAIANFDLTVVEIDQLFKLVEGETRLLLHGLHSVLQLPSEDYYFISTHHASFLDFLNDHSRSHKFYVGSLDHRMDLAQSFLRLCADRDRSWDWFSPDVPRRPWVHLIPFLTSLPPSIQLCLLIARMEPDHIFNLNNNNFEDMLAWLQRIPSAPQGLIELWKDYVYMAPWGTFDGTCLVKHINSPSSELCQVLVASLYYGLHSIPHLLDITWDELRTIICSVRPNITGTGYQATSGEILQAIIPWENQRWICRDIALKCIHRIVNACGDHGETGIKYYEWLVSCSKQNI